MLFRWLILGAKPQLKSSQWQGQQLRYFDAKRPKQQEWVLPWSYCFLGSQFARVFVYSWKVIVRWERLTNSDDLLAWDRLSGGRSTDSFKLDEPFGWRESDIYRSLSYFFNFGWCQLIVALVLNLFNVFFLHLALLKNLSLKLLEKDSNFIHSFLIQTTPAPYFASSSFIPKNILKDVAKV